MQKERRFGPARSLAGDKKASLSSCLGCPSPGLIEAARAFIEIGTGGECRRASAGLVEARIDRGRKGRPLGAMMVAALALAAPGMAASDTEADTMVAEARAFLASGKTADAIAAFEKAARLQPKNGKVRNALGSLLNMNGRYPEALVHAQAAVAAEPGNGRYRYNRGVVLAEHGRFEEAIADFDAGIVAHPDNAYAYLERGAALLSLGRAAEARSDWAKAGEIDPKLIWTRWYEATGDFVAGEYGKAAAGFDAVAAAEPGFTAAHAWRSLALARAGTPVTVTATAAGEWPAPLLAYLAGTIDADALLAAARADAKAGDARREGEALHFIAQQALIKGRRDEAAAWLRKAAAVKAPRHVWKLAAEQELARLEAAAG